MPKEEKNSEFIVQLSGLIASTSGKNENEKYDIIIDFLSNPNITVNIADIRYLIEVCGIESEYRRSRILGKYLSKHNAGTNAKDAELLREDIRNIEFFSEEYNIKDEANKAYIISKILSNPSIAENEVVGVFFTMQMYNIKHEKNKAYILGGGLSNPNITPSRRYVLSLIRDKEIKSEDNIAYLFGKAMSNPNIILDNIEFVLKEYNHLINEYIRNNATSVSLSDSSDSSDSDTEAEYFSGFEYTNDAIGTSYSDTEDIVPIIREYDTRYEKNKTYIFGQFLSNPKTEADIGDVASFIKRHNIIGERNIAYIIGKFILNPNTTESMEDIEPFLRGNNINLKENDINDIKYKYNRNKVYASPEPDNNISIKDSVEDIVSFMRKNNIIYEYEKRDFITELLLKSNTEVDAKHIADLLEEKKIDRVGTRNIIAAFLSSLNPMASPKYIADLFKKCDISEYDMRNIINDLLKSDTDISPKYVADLLRESGVTDIYDICDIVKIRSKSKAKIHTAYVVELLEECKVKDQNIRYNVIVELISDVPIIGDDIAYLIKRCGITDEYNKFNIIIIFLSSLNPMASPQYAADLLRDNNMTNDYYMHHIIAEFLLRRSEYTLSNIEDKLKMANKMIIACCGRYEAEAAVSVYMRCIPDNNDIIPHLLDALKDLYPNLSFIQAEFLEMAIDEYMINQSNFLALGLERNNSHFKTEDLFDLLKYLREHRVLPGVNSNLTILSIVKNRFSTKYSSLTEILKEKKWEEYLTDDGLEMIKAEFGEVLPEDITILGLISYYDIYNKISSLSKCFTEGIKDDITSNFKPSKDRLFISSEELNKVNALVQYDAQGKFIPVKDLCDYFLETINFTPLQAEDFKANFVNSPFEEDEEDAQDIAEWKQKNRQEINEIFKDVLFKEGAEAVKPIERAMAHLANSMNDPEIKETITNYAGVLQVFFQQSKSNLAILLSQEGGLALFQNVLVTLNHGCAANIGSQITLALFSALLSKQNTDEKVANINEGIIFSVLDRAITDIINSVVNEDIIHTANNPLLNRTIRNYYFSPDALFKAISETYVDKKDEITGNNPWEAISDSIQKIMKEVLDPDRMEENLNKDGTVAILMLSKSNFLKNEIMEKISKESLNGDLSNRDTADIATYLLLESNNPLLSSKLAKLADCLEYKKAEKVINDIDAKIIVRAESVVEETIEQAKSTINLLDLISTSNQSQSGTRLSEDISSLLHTTQTNESAVPIIRERTNGFSQKRMYG